MFKRSSSRYGDTPAPVTPYQKAAQAWDERIGSARVQAANWRWMALGLGPVALSLCGASTPDDQKRIDEVLAKAGLERFAEVWFAAQGLEWAAYLAEDFRVQRIEASS